MVSIVRGLVRPLVTFGVVGVLSYLALEGKVEATVYTAIVATVVGYWFGSRTPLNGNTTA